MYIIEQVIRYLTKRLKTKLIKMDTSTSLLSVIIPVYNVEYYIKPCLESVINQTYKNLEIILINDGSTDKSPDICEEYAQMDTRVKVIHQENNGQSAARNKGLDASTGDYITFIDSDDYIDLNTYSVNMSLLIREREINMIQFPFEYQNKIYGLPVKPYTISGEEDIFANWWSNDILSPSVGNKIFRKEVFNSIRFPEGQIYEDYFLIVDFSEIIQNTYLSNEGCYHYVVRDGSTTNSTITINQCIDFFRAHIKVYEKFHSYEELRPYKLTAFSRVYRKLITARRLDHEANLSVYINMLGKYIPTWKDVIHTTSGIKERIWVSCVKIIGIKKFLNTYSRYLNIKKVENSL